ncbi:MAG: hypothetical protein Ct9H300mP28_12090 [Pseudomonadota bacterium]|nr:MAG: hypothetical protein Ct9H300mP28_12090 [Pseudomonadota bacterium]
MDIPVRESVFAFLPTADTEARVLGQYVTQNHAEQELIIWDQKSHFSKGIKALSKNCMVFQQSCFLGKLVDLSRVGPDNKKNLISKSIWQFSDTINF